ncbi:TonB-dependent receptor [Sphingopyxis panaciterrulae]|uniref:Outer membrane receptor protein involved in Fe transport n=1 Tax=Sphingopyxis panaciterrulae TaxID=462372 RepID=A0A7W9B650_9SPHN|nr:TonB-dependent receptor [Sphingopyxis panaciterrulae]MBB5706970.1 outer membrane receptor protein involved in Fe transport [Sphingopyxis panaciterrulae]
MRNRGRLSLYGCGSAALALWLAAAPVAAAQSVRSFDIPAGDLGRALNSFARQANQELIFSSALVAGKRTKGVRGGLEPRAALDILLEGSGLRVEGGSVLTLRPSGGAEASAVRRQTASAVRPVARAAYVQDSAPEPVVAAAPEERAPQPASEIIVTGSRITRDGYEAPTPTTVLSMEDIQDRAPTNIADYVNQLPSMGIGNSPRTTLMFANATGGANQMSARGLGVTRTLTLLDGRRVVGSGMSPAVDVNLLPQNLVQRVDVVTGGASAAYGSDAVAGVVNFILDTKFTGVKGSLNFSQTDRSDGRVVSGDLAYGTPFADGRGHILLSGSYFKGRGIDSPLSRDWYRPGYRLMTNPDWTATNGEPGQIVRYDAGYNSTPGGVIASGPLKGMQFLPDGQVGQFVFGPIQQGQMQAGGSVEDTAYRWPLLPDDKHWSTYGRLSYDLTDNVTAIVEAGYAGSDTHNWSAAYNRQGASAIIVSRENPYLPLATQQAMDDAGVTEFAMNRLFYDMVNNPGGHAGEAGYHRRQDRFLVALEGRFLDSGQWRAYYQRGHSDVWYTRDNNLIPARFNQAIDVIANPATGGVSGVAAGAPICRSTLADPGNGCVPMNIFGEGALGAASIAWVTGLSDGYRTRQDLDFRQDVWSIDAQYEPFSTWAGPVSIAAGFEYRKESFSSTADELSLASRWNVGNFKGGTGKYNVKEFFGEVLVPLLRDSALGRSLDLNAAVRRTDYSTSGPVTTWKAGLTWDITDDLRLRGTRSRDIRAPNLNDLYAPGSQFVNAYFDRTQPGSPQVSNRTISGGNPNLTPEIADTWTAGGIYSPHWLPGFSLSVDWYKIDIRDAIVGVGAQTIIDQCYGYNRPQNPAACTSIVLAPGATNLVDATIYTGGINAQEVAVEGIDYEASYRAKLDEISGSLPGAINLRLLVSQRLKDETNLPGDTTPPTLGTTSSLKWKAMLTGTYAVGPSRTTLTVRYLGPGKVTNYPMTSQQGLADDVNHVDSTWYFDLSENYDLSIAGAKVTLFGVVENLFDRTPEPIPGGYIGFGTNNPYDLLGRTYRMGLRFKF